MNEESTTLIKYSEFVMNIGKLQNNKYKTYKWSLLRTQEEKKSPGFYVHGIFY